MMFWNKKGPPIDWIGRRVSYQSHAGAPIDGDQNAKLTFEHDLLKFQGEEL